MKNINVILFTMILMLTAACEMDLVISVVENPYVSIRTLNLSDGKQLEFGLVMPEIYDPDQAYPVCIVFPSGDQGRVFMENGLEHYWIRSSIQANWIIASPIAPEGIGFDQGSEIYIPELMDWLMDEFTVEGGKFHIAGASSGGISVFRVGVRYYKRLFSILAFPGGAQGSDMNIIENIRGLHIAMFIGLRDSNFLELSDRTAEKLDELEIPFTYRKLPEDGHVISSISSEGWVKILESFRPSNQGP